MEDKLQIALGCRVSIFENIYWFLKIPEGEERDTFLPIRLEQNYHELKADIAQLEFTGDVSNLGGSYLMLYYVSIGRLAYGKIEALSDILTYLPHVHRNAAHFCRWRFLIPFPEGLNPITNLEQAQEWFKQHANLLKWNEETLLYELENDA